MKSAKLFWGIFGVMAVVLLAQCSVYCEMMDYKIFMKPEYNIKISGDSTIHRWHAKSKEFELDAKMRLVYEPEKEGQQLLNDVVLIAENKNIVLTVPVKSLRSGTLGLKGRIRKIMKYKEYPNIVFEMSSYSVRKSTESENRFYLDMKGGLTIIETTREITLSLEVAIGKDEISVVGKTSVLMTDFGIKPPKLLFVKAADLVDIEWRISLGVEKPDKADEGKHEELSNKKSW